MNYIDTKAKCHKKFTFKGTLRQVLIYLEPHPSRYTLNTYMYLLTLGRRGEVNQREG